MSTLCRPRSCGTLKREYAKTNHWSLWVIFWMDNPIYQKSNSSVAVFETCKLIPSIPSYWLANEIVSSIITRWGPQDS